MRNGSNGIFVEMMFWFKFYMDLSPFLCLETFGQTLGTNLSLRESKLGFWGENEVLPEGCLSWLATASNLVAMASDVDVQLAMASNKVSMASCTVQQLMFLSF